MTLVMAAEPRMSRIDPAEANARRSVRLGMASEMAPNISDRRDAGAEDLPERPHEGAEAPGPVVLQGQADQQQQRRPDVTSSSTPTTAIALASR